MRITDACRDGEHDCCNNLILPGSCPCSCPQALDPPGQMPHLVIILNERPQKKRGPKPRDDYDLNSPFANRVRAAVASGLSHRQVAEQFGIGKSTVGRLVNYQTRRKEAS